MEATTLTTGGDNSLLRGVRSTLEEAEEALLCVAFVQKAGVHLLRGPLERLGPRARLLHTTTFTKCSTALGMAHGFGANVGILNPSPGTYHPKIYLARCPGALVAVIGSANLTGGLVNNVEAAVMLRGTESDEPLRRAWEFAEGLWSDPRRRAWTPALDGATDDETFAPELYAALVATIEANHHLFHTLGATPKPNRIVEVTPAGLYVETESSKEKGNPPQIIPAWMFTLAWEYLRTHGQLSNRYLLAADGLNVKRSSAVCAVLSRLPGVTALASQDEGIVLSWKAA